MSAEVKSVASQSINHTHGSLLILHPGDEEPIICNGYEDHGLTFFKHSSKGVRDKDGTSLGIVFCATHHLTEVKSDSGLVVLNDKLEIKTMGTMGDNPVHRQS